MYEEIMGNIHGKQGDLGQPEPIPEITAEEYVKQGDLGQPEPIPGKPGENRDKPEFRVILIGKTWVGKSALGNSICGEDTFESKFSLTGVTQFCMRGRADRFERDVQVIDTPGLFHTSTPIERLKSEISRCLVMSLPGPHAFLLVLRLGRFTKEDQDTISQFAEMFGESFFRFAVVVFTGEDELRCNMMTIDDFLQGAPRELKALLEKCGNRHVCFDNRAQQKEKDSRCQKLIEIVDTIQATNEGKFFTNETYSHVFRRFVESSKSTLSEFRKDRVLPRSQQMIKRTQYNEELLASRVKLRERGITEDADLQAKVDLLELRLKEIEAALANKQAEYGALRIQVEAIEKQRIEHVRSEAAPGKTAWLVSIVKPFISQAIEMLRFDLLWRRVTT